MLILLANSPGTASGGDDRFAEPSSLPSFRPIVRRREFASSINVGFGPRTPIFVTTELA
jgi:hypothetical protein